MGQKETSTSYKFWNCLFLFKINSPAPPFLSLPLTISLILSSIYWDASVSNLRKEEQIRSCLLNSPFKIIGTGILWALIKTFFLQNSYFVSKRSREFNELFLLTMYRFKPACLSFFCLTQNKILWKILLSIQWKSVWIKSFFKISYLCSKS